MAGGGRGRLGDVIPSLPTMPDVEELREREAPERRIEEVAGRIADDYRSAVDQVVREDPKGLEVDMLAAENFDPDECE